MKFKEYLTQIFKNKYVSTIAKSVATLALLTAVCAISVHYLMGDTLSEYAEKNPDIAYRAVEEIPDSDNNTVEEVSDATDNVAPENLDTTQDNTTEVASEESNNIANNSSYVQSTMIHFYNPSDTSPERVTYSDGFYYEPLSEEMIDYITGTSYPADQNDLAITTDDLRYIGIQYVDFNGITQAGEIICNAKIAEDLVDIFYKLYEADYQLEKVVLIDNYGGDDTASMCADNTSCFNYRVVDDTTSLSNHAYGLAIDVNPFYNPYIVYGRNDDGSDYISPPGSEQHADRSASFAYKIDENDLCYKLFIEHGFKWGGNWNSCKDYQHFQKK